MSYKNNSAINKITFCDNKTPYIVSYSLLYTCEAKIQCVKCRLFYHLNPNIYMILKTVCAPHLSHYFFF